MNVADPHWDQEHRTGGAPEPKLRLLGKFLGLVPHAATQHQTIDPANQNAEEVQLGGNLGAAHHSRHRPFRLFQRATQSLEFGLHQPPRRRRQKASQGFG